MSVQVDDRPHRRLSRLVAVQGVVDREHVAVRQIVHPAHRDGLASPRLERGARVLAVVAPERRRRQVAMELLPGTPASSPERADRRRTCPLGLMPFGIGSASTKGVRVTCASARRARTNVPPLPSAMTPLAAPPMSFKNLRRSIARRACWREPHEDLLTSVRVARGPFCRTEPVDRLDSASGESSMRSPQKSMSEIPERAFSGVRQNDSATRNDNVTRSKHTKTCFRRGAATISAESPRGNTVARRSRDETCLVSLGIQSSPMSKLCETMRAPGRSSRRSLGRNR